MSRSETTFHESSQPEDDLLPTPDGGYGWVIVGSCFILNGLTWGVTASFGVYLTEYVSSKKVANAKPMEYGLVGGLNFSCAMLLAPLATYLAGRYPLKAVVLLGCFLQSIGYVTAPFASRTWQLYLTQGALVGSGIGFIIVPSMAVLSQWFSKRRSMANGISSAGSGVGGAAFTWGTAAMIQRQGLNWALRATGIITFPNQRAFDISLLRSKAVVLLLLWAFISMFGYIVLLFSLSEFALAIGLSHKQATDVVGFLNVGTAVGRPLIGLVSDRFSRVATAFVLTLLCGLTCFVIWLPAKSFGLTLFFSTVCGAILGVFWMTIGPLSAEVAGIKNLQSMLSLAWAATIIPTASE
ncbi:putative transporter MCH2 [Fusarium oxysporum f. sp. raphani]|uniref:Putative transporter MCH2 n=1 Tax=Fusarium oxysporum f. sp. raphani TaxID=96318 RepID=A0A8J5UGZ0_FUSOX|nr:putative transporter MCH2 [Fusarium oxysporum f. sp. raphani]